MTAEFNIIGFHKDIYLNGKFYGSIKMNEADRETMGYSGRRVEVLDQDFKNKTKRLRQAQRLFLNVCLCVGG